ncbi:unannotated protein [freshwater metagenome]|uniref:Unannotated protein n=1 Tax=freshwater metagenome TaxID=449393 RepID=A0A6J6FC03_9ZZZZ|nr:hypothetical protein [Actinomycetota bacterium]
MKRSLREKLKKLSGVLLISITLVLITPAASFADDDAATTSSSQEQESPGNGHKEQERERGLRIDGDFDASHPSEWIAIGVAIGLAVALAYTAGRRRKSRE